MKTKGLLLIALAAWMTISSPAAAILICNKFAMKSFQDQNALAEELVTQAGIRYFEALAWSETAFGQIEAGALAQASGSFDQAAGLLAEAGDLYGQVIAIGRKVGIKPSYMEAMRNIDYTGLEERLGLQATIWEEVASVGGQGDVLGLFQRMQQYIQSLTGGAQTLADVTAKGAPPTLDQVIDLTNTWEEATTFGHYTVILAREVEKALGP